MASVALFAHDEHIVVPAQSLAEQFVAQALSVELGGINMVDTEVDRTPQQGKSASAIATQTREMHRAKADS